MYESLFKAGSDSPPEIRSAQIPPIGEGVIDESTFKTAEVERLFDAVNQCETVVGQATLFRSLVQPLSDLESIEAKQRAVEEIQQDNNLREHIEALVSRAAGGENSLYKLLYGTFLGFMGKPVHQLEFEGYGYEPYKQGTRFVLNLIDDARSIASPKCDYLNDIIARITKFADSRWYSLMRGPAYKTERGFLTKQEKKPYTPAFVFKPTLVKPLFFLGMVAFFVFLVVFAPLSTVSFSSAAIPLVMVLSIPLLGVYVPIVGTFDRDSCIYPLREGYRDSPELVRAMEALGRLDELLSLVRYAEHFGDGFVMAEMGAADAGHSMVLTDAKNPILAKQDKSYVANDVTLKDQRLSFISGPNSGGKTAICKTIVQIQLLSQIGCPVPAGSAKMTVADHIFYQTPEFSSLDDGEGRFGTELKRTKQIFLAATARSLVVLDELSEGTTYEEKLETSSNVLNGFLKKGNTTVLITHNHELIDRFIDQGIGRPLQVEFKSYKPTYRLIDGISRVSHADRVARKIGFSKEDIAGYLKGDE